jgi:hypothetical protein
MDNVIFMRRIQRADGDEWAVFTGDLTGDQTIDAKPPDDVILFSDRNQAFAYAMGWQRGDPKQYYIEVLNYDYLEWMDGSELDKLL